MINRPTTIDKTTITPSVFGTSIYIITMMHPIYVNNNVIKSRFKSHLEVKCKRELTSPNFTFIEMFAFNLKFKFVISWDNNSYDWTQNYINQTIWRMEK